MIATIESPASVQTHSSPADRWVDEYGDYLFRFAMSRLHDISAAEDAIQETLLAAIRSRQRFSNGSTERTWLTAILKHKIADHYRSIFSHTLLAGSIPLDETDAFYFGSSGQWRGNLQDTPMSEMDQKEFVVALRSAIVLLPKRLAIVFTLREIEGMATKEICGLLNITRENLFVMIHRARLQLRETLAPAA